MVVSVLFPIFSFQRLSDNIQLHSPDSDVATIDLVPLHFQATTTERSRSSGSMRHFPSDNSLLFSSGKFGEFIRYDPLHHAKRSRSASDLAAKTWTICGWITSVFELS